ncbi:hypothetical protein K503DRAFT_774166 [Rhizopogon vinicolor AM-OR11-026]|uniref:Uncharacterized protein n=1 Tax=Rhizopogon vinicolor AM-OR11-026 TaxID=1314800 RepID=A0A1B7MQC5_9AGAM|nr:hypothetical protein K503DRAFT_774166 [Rhizopogon vinicolor AM-OR11-026]
MASSSGLRQPKETHKGRNGFREKHIPLDSSNPDDLAISRHHFAQYILSSKRSNGPSSLDELIATPDAPPKETLATVEDKIKELKKQHQEDLELFSAFQSAEYYQEVRDRYSCIDDSMTGVDTEDQIQIDYLAALNELYSDARPMKRFQHGVDDALSQLRYNYLKQLLQLLGKRRAFKMQESKIRKHREAQFPSSVEEYHNIPERDIQLRIARFLMRSNIEQEKTLDHYGWSSRAVQPLLSAFKTNEGFKNEILESVKDAAASDPRRRPTTTPGWQL